MPSTSKKADVSKSLPVGDLEVKSIEFKLPEDEQEKALRLHKERISFYIKDVVIWIFGVVCLVVTGSYCLSGFSPVAHRLRRKRTGRARP